MKTVFIIGGPVILVVMAVAILVHSNILMFGTVDGFEHQAGAEAGGTFVTEEQTLGSFSAVAGMELEDQPIEYRDGLTETVKTRQPGLKKFGPITLKWPVHRKDFDIPFFNWVILGVDESVQADLAAHVDDTAQIEGVAETDTETETELEEGVEMRMIDPPTLVIPAR